MNIEDDDNYMNSESSSSSENLESTEEESEPKGYSGSPFGGLGVINLKGNKKDKKKRRVTKGPLKDYDTLEKGFLRASLRMSDAYSRGLEEYLDRRERSAQRKRDGAISDSYENITKAMAKMVKV